MKQSLLFTKTRKNAPKDEVAKNADLLIRAGYIHKEMAGVYSFLPLGLRVLSNIAQIVREEMDAVDGQEVSMTALQDKQLWEKTGRFDDAIVDNWFKTALKNGSELGLAFSHEEPLTQIMSEYVSSYRDLPVSVYQIQTKFRNEARAKSGIMRGREFLMKDMYSFSRDDKEHAEQYEKIKKAYGKVFGRLGLGEKTHVTFASGGVFSKYSEEFQTESDAGEDLIYIDKKSGRAINKEIMENAATVGDALDAIGAKKEDLIEKKAIEVGNIFHLGTRFSDPFGLNFVNTEGKKMPVLMGCYGIGISRLMGTIVEVLSDDNGIVWPVEVAPYRVHLIALFDKDSGVDAKGERTGKVAEAAEKLYGSLQKMGVSVLYDDRDLRAGEKFADSDLIGIPMRVVISEKTLAESIVEIKDRKTGAVEKISESDLIKYVSGPQK